MINFSVIFKISKKLRYSKDKRLLPEQKEALKSAQKVIAAIDDPLIRVILSDRYLNGLSWRRVAINAGGGNTADGCRKIAKRYIEKNGESRKQNKGR